MKRIIIGTALLATLGVNTLYAQENNALLKSNPGNVTKLPPLMVDPALINNKPTIVNDNLLVKKVGQSDPSQAKIAPSVNSGTNNMLTPPESATQPNSREQPNNGTLNLLKIN